MTAASTPIFLTSSDRDFQTYQVGMPINVDRPENWNNSRTVTREESDPAVTRVSPARKFYIYAYPAVTLMFLGLGIPMWIICDDPAAQNCNPAISIAGKVITMFGTAMVGFSGWFWCPCAFPPLLKDHTLFFTNFRQP